MHILLYRGSLYSRSYQRRAGPAALGPQTTSGDPGIALFLMRPANGNSILDTYEQF